MSALISGVKNFESKATSLLRGFPFSQVQSQSENGSIFAFFTDVAPEVSMEACPVDGSTDVPAGARNAIFGGEGSPEVAPVGTASAEPRLFNSASSWSMRFLIASSSFSSAAGIVGALD